jgi:hypothetical protein
VQLDTKQRSRNEKHQRSQIQHRTQFRLFRVQLELGHFFFNSSRSLGELERLARNKKLFFIQLHALVLQLSHLHYHLSGLVIAYFTIQKENQHLVQVITKR